MFIELQETLNNLKPLTPISPIYEGASFVNDQISEGNYFFNDIKTEGILLYTSKRKQLARKRKLSITEIKTQAEDYFEDWFQKALMDFLIYMSTALINLIIN